MGGGGCKQRVKEAECSGNIMYSCMKMKKKWDMLKLLQESGGKGGKREWWRQWILLWDIIRNFVNVTMYPKYNNNVI
jgi:hypothetical protein